MSLGSIKHAHPSPEAKPIHLQSAPIGPPNTGGSSSQAGHALKGDGMSLEAKAGLSTPAVPLGAVDHKGPRPWGGLIATGTAIVAGTRSIRVMQALPSFAPRLQAAMEGVHKATTAHQVNITRLDEATENLVTKQRWLSETEGHLQRSESLAFSRSYSTSREDVSAWRYHSQDLPVRQRWVKEAQSDLTGVKAEHQATRESLASAESRVTGIQSEKGQSLLHSASRGLGVVSVIAGSIETYTAVSQFRKGEMRSGALHSLAAAGQFAIAVPQLTMGTIIRNAPELAPKMLRLGVVGAVVATTAAIASLVTD